MAIIKKTVSWCLILLAAIIGLIDPLNSSAVSKTSTSPKRIKEFHIEYKSKTSGLLIWKKTDDLYYKLRRRKYTVKYIDSNGSTKSVVDAGKWKTLGKVGGNVTSFYDKVKSYDKSYQYQILGYNRKGKLTHRSSTVAYYRLAEVSSFCVEAEFMENEDNASVELCMYDEAGWFGDGLIHPTEYEIQRKERGGIYKQVCSIKGNYYKDSGLQKHKTYVWRVRGKVKLGSKILKTKWKTLTHKTANPSAKLSVKLISHKTDEYYSTNSQSGTFVFSITSDKDNGDFLFSGDMYLGVDNGCDEQRIINATAGGYYYDGMESTLDGYIVDGIHFESFPYDGVIIHPGDTFSFSVSYVSVEGSEKVTDPMKGSWRFYGIYNDVGHVFFLDFEKNNGKSIVSEYYYE